VLAAERLHGDDTTVPVLAKGKTDTGRCWVYARDDRPFAGPAPPAAVFHYSRDRRGEHPQRHLARWSGILQADAYGGYEALYVAGRSPRPIRQALCWAHGRRKLFELADIAEAARRKARGKTAIISPIALEAVKRVDALFDIERDINGCSAAERLAIRQERSAPGVAALESWMREQRARLSRHDPVAKALDYMLTRWPAFTGFLDDGRICLTNNSAERALRGLALGRRSWLFAGSDRGGAQAAMMYSLITTARMNDVDPQVRLADVLARIADILPGGSTNCSLGTGNRPPGVRRPDHGGAEPRLHHNPRRGDVGRGCRLAVRRRSRNGPRRMAAWPSMTSATPREPSPSPASGSRTSKNSSRSTRPIRASLSATGSSHQ
jgi:transposase